MSATAPPAAARKELSAPQKAMHKLGLVRDIDLALHLPLRYEDETRIVRLCDTRDGEVAQVEGVVTKQDIQYRPRRQLLVTLDDGSDTCTLRFFSFYPSHQKTLAVGARVRVRGEVRGGFMGKTMMHPAFHAAGGELPDALTPVYPTSAQLPQAYLRKAVLSALGRASLHEVLPPGSAPAGLPSLREEVAQMVDQLSAAHQEGHAWGDMAMICRTWSEMEACGRALKQRGLPHQVRKGSGTFNPAADTIKVLTMHVSKGLEFPVVALVGAGRMPAEGEDEREEARLF